MRKHGISDLDALQARSTEDIEWFWNAVLEDLDIRFYRPYSNIVDLSRGIERPVWCVGGEMNIIHNCLDKWRGTATEKEFAVKYESEAGQTRYLTYGELAEAVERCAAALRHHGLGKGDAVGIYMPMCPEIVIAFLAIAKIGGIILPLFSGFGTSAIVSRLTDAHARAIFTANGFHRRGKEVRMFSTVQQVLDQVPAVETVIVYPYLSGDDGLDLKPGRDHGWRDFLASTDASSPTERTSAEDPVMIIYTSGTTGKPKGTVHTHCGFPIKAAQDTKQGMDLKAGETMFWMSDMGWMMGPWLVFGTLINEAAMMLYDGAPDFPDAGRVWSMVERHNVTHLGLSPTFVRTIIPHGTDPIKDKNLDTLRAVCSTGSPWDPESWLWLFKNVLESRKPILNISGGTEISGGIVSGNVLTPMKPCSFSGPVPGIDADVVDEAGNSVRGVVGELVIRKPWIGMTRGFWQDEARYLETYWSRLRGVWVHGDFAGVDEDGLWYILGRSDDTIKVAGKRLGPAEVESIINRHPEVSESAAIGVPHDVKGEDVVVFCVLKPDSPPSHALRGELADAVASELGKPLKPWEIKFVTALPKTRNAKVMHRVIRAAFLGNETGDLSGLEDPASIDAIRQSQ